jgi:ABC-type amino acid transport substrate-binding protein
MKRTTIAMALIACIAAGAALAQSRAAKGGGTPASFPAGKAGAALRPPGSAQRTLRFISDFNSPPFSYKEGMKRLGPDIDLAEALGKELGAKIEWVEMGFNINNYVSALERGTADAAIASISITPKRQERLAFTRPYFHTSLAIAVNSDVDWEHQWFTTGLKGWTVGVMRNTTGEKWARANLSANVETYSTIDRLVQRLKNSRGALKSGLAGFCILHDQAILRWALSNYSYHYQIAETGISPESYGIAVRKGNTKLLAELNSALDNLDANGTYQKIYQKWFAQAADRNLPPLPE